MLNLAQRLLSERTLFKKLSLLFMMLFSLNYASASGLDSFLNKGTSFENQPTEFLRVDEAFVFNSEMTNEGFKLNWVIEPGYYLYYERFKFTASNESTELGAPEFSTQGDGKDDPYFGLVHAITGELSIFLPVRLAENITEDEITVSYQGCAEAGLCYPPKKQKILFTASASADASKVTASNNSKNTQSSSQPLLNADDNLEDASGIFNFLSNNSLPLIIGIFFLLGLGLTFTPCVFPMIPIISSIIAGQSRPTAGKSLALASAYVLGMALTYALAGVLTGLLGAGANIQAALQNPYVLSVFAGIFVLLSLAMFGFYELQLPAFIRDKLNTTSQNLTGGHLSSVFFIGALSALVVSPCVSAPLAGALIYISSTADAVVGGLSLFAMGLGMGVPLIIIAVSGGKLMPKAGQWMNQVKYVFGVMLLAVAIWLLSRFIPSETSMLLWALLIGLSATQMGAFEAAKAGWPRFFKGLGLVFALYASILFIGFLTGANDPFKPLAKFTQSSQMAGAQATVELVDFNVIYNEAGLEQERLKARDANKPMLLDFYADWCISCVIMVNTVFPLPEIRSKLEQFHLVKADITNNSAENQALLDKFGLFGPPSILFFDSEGNENKDIRIVGEIAKEAFEQRLISGLVK